MFNWLRRRRLSTEARRKLLLAAARSEEAIIETHVKNALDLVNSLGDEVTVDRGIDLYVEMMELPDNLAAAVTNRLLARLEPVVAADTGPRPRRAKRGPGQSSARR